MTCNVIWEERREPKGNGNAPQTEVMYTLMRSMSRAEHVHEINHKRSLTRRCCPARFDIIHNQNLQCWNNERIKYALGSDMFHLVVPHQLFIFFLSLSHSCSPKNCKPSHQRDVFKPVVCTPKTNDEKDPNRPPAPV